MYATRRYVTLLVAAAVLLSSCLALAKGGSVSVRGYVRKDGTYVPPHRRSAPDNSRSNNWSTKGNVNPYTGEKGTKNLESVPFAPVTPSPTTELSLPSAPSAVGIPSAPDAPTAADGRDGSVAFVPIATAKTKLKRVVDAITFITSQGVTVRLLGVEAPKDQAAQARAKDELGSLLSGRVLGLCVPDGLEGRDSVSAYVLLPYDNNRVINDQMIYLGHLQPDPACDHPLRRRFESTKAWVDALTGR